MFMKKIQYFGMIIGLLIYSHVYAVSQAKICLTGKLETTLTTYKTAILNAVDLGLIYRNGAKAN